MAGYDLGSDCQNFRCKNRSHATRLEAECNAEVEAELSADCSGAPIEELSHQGPWLLQVARSG